MLVLFADTYTMINGNEVTLTESECKIAKYLAVARETENRKTGAIGTPYVKDQRTIDENAFGAELAFCKLFNVYPDMTITPRVGGEDCIDVFGEKIDVKNTDKEWPQYFVKKTKSTTPNAKVDYFAWMIGTLPNFKYIGKASWDTVMNCKTTQPHGEGSECFVVESNLLSRGSEAELAT